MTDKTLSIKKIFKNTGILYIRSVLVLLITLYTSRVVLKALGIDDYGLYNVIGGVVGLFNFLRTTLTKSTQRFLNTAMVQSDNDLNATFCTSMNIHIVIALSALFLCETVGLWFLNTYIQIPPGRGLAANIVFQSTIFSLVLTILSVPYNAEIIAHEDMGYFAVVSIIDAVIKLLISFCIMVDTDRLVLYGYLMAGVYAVNLFLFFIYCRRKYEESRYRIFFNKKLTRKMLGYTSWTVFGQAAIVVTNQGNNILVNMFHSVTANAAMGVATQVNSAIVSLTANFQTAFNPQITKSFAANQYDYLKSLVFSTCKISYLLLFLVGIPIMFNIDLLLDIWLDEVPPYSNIFCILIIWNSILNAFSAPFNFCVLSSGKIKYFQIATSLVYLSDLLVVYLFFCMGAPAFIALVVKVFIMFVLLFVRVYYCYREVPCIDAISFLKEVFRPMFFVSVTSVSFGLLLFRLANDNCSTLFSTLLLIAITFVVVVCVGLTNSERQKLLSLIRNKTNNNRR